MAMIRTAQHGYVKENGNYVRLSRFRRGAPFVFGLYRLFALSYFLLLFVINSPSLPAVTNPGAPHALFPHASACVALCVDALYLFIFLLCSSSHFLA